MSHIKNFNSFLNELHQLGDKKKAGKHVLLYRDKLWIFDDDSYEAYRDEITAALGTEYYYLSDLDNAVESDEVLPNVVFGFIQGSNLTVTGNRTFRPSATSPDVKKLIKRLKLKGLQVTYKDPFDSYKDLRHSVEVDPKAKLEHATFYHGTCVSSLGYINQIGIAPRSISQNVSNHHGIDHKDKIFITTAKEYAAFHALNAARKMGSFPVLLEFRIPDPSKLVVDYDIATTYMRGSDRFKQAGYDQIDTYVGGQDLNIKNLDNKLGIYAYRGRIPASFISAAYVDAKNLPQYLSLNGSYRSYRYDDYGGKHVSDFQKWKQYGLDELWDYVSRETERHRQELGDGYEDY